MVPPSKPLWRLTLTEPLRPHFHGLTRSRSDGKKLSIPLTSRTPASRRGEQSTTYWQVRTLLPSVAHLKLHRFTTREQRGTQDEGPRFHKVHQRRCPNYGRSQHLGRYSISGTFTPEQLANALTQLIARKISGTRVYFPGVYTPCRISSQILVMRFLHFMHMPTQNSLDLDNSTSSCDPYVK